jgi:geranylgeranyl pyrophosphate synthase
VGLLGLGHDKTLEQAAEVVDLLERYGSLDYARRLARGLIDDALGRLDALPASSARDILASMADFFLERER